MSAQLPVQTGAKRWWMLLIICLGFITLTLNWFNVSTSFTPIAETFGVGLGPLTLLISLFIIAYGVAHIPGGILATALGMRVTIALGLFVQGLAGIMSGLSTSYGMLAVSRVISGIGGSIFIAVAFAAVSIWFHGNRHTLAMGLAGGGAFSCGVMFALYVWIYVQAATGWRASLIIAGVIEVVVGLITLIWLRFPDNVADKAERFRARDLKKALLQRDLWVYGISLLGAYGANFAVSQLIVTYVVEERHMSAVVGGLIAGLNGLAGIPGSILGGMLADRNSKRFSTLVWVPLVLCGVLCALMPILPNWLVWLPPIALGFLIILAFSVWSTVPARVANIHPAHVGTATGLMLTIAAVGGFFVPIAFGQIVPTMGYTVGWIVLGIISVVFGLVAIAGRNPVDHTVQEDHSQASPKPVLN